MTRLILVGGCSGSGKTFLAQNLARSLRGSTNILSTDNYYRDFSMLTPEERERIDFDDPASCDEELMEHQLRNLKAGSTVRLPTYDFHRHIRENNGVEISPSDWVILEGIFSLSFEMIRHHSEFSIYMKVPLDICFERRVKRDLEERGRTREEVHWRFWEHAVPNYNRHADTHEKVADLVLDSRRPIQALLADVSGPLNSIGPYIGMLS